MNALPNAGLRQVISATRFRNESGNWVVRFPTTIAAARWSRSGFSRTVSSSWPIWCGRSMFRSRAPYQPIYKQSKQGESPLLEILFSHDWPLPASMCCWSKDWCTRRDQRVSDERPTRRGAASVKLVTLLDRQSARRVQLQPDYFGFLVDDAYLCGYGLGSAEQTGRNLPYVQQRRK